MAILCGAYGPKSTDIARKLKERYQSFQAIGQQDTFFCMGIKDKKNDNIIANTDATSLAMGRIFSKKDQSPLDKLPDDITCQDIISHYWGRYVAILFDKQTNTLKFLRDPIGLTTLYYTQVQESVIFSTNMALLYDLLETKPDINWDYFIEFLYDNNYMISSMPFNNVQEILPGVEYTISNKNITHELIWHPTPQKEHFAHTSDKDIEEGLLDQLTSCTKAWLKETPGCTVELSGGLDSSSVLVLLSTLKDQNIPITAVHHNDRISPSSQELKYAQEIAQAYDVNLHVIDFNDHKFIDPQAICHKPCKPNNFFLFPGMSNELLAHAQSTGCTEIFSGQGGDHVFLAPPPLSSVADHWLDHGFKNISTTANQISSLYRMPIWQIAKHSLSSLSHYYRGKLYESPQERDIDFLTDHAKEHMKKAEIFYLETLMKHYNPAKAEHIKMLSHAVAYGDREQRYKNTTVTHILLSQPLVEYGLKIPTYRSVKDTYHRYFLRKAMSNLTQSPVIWRRSKGEVSASYLKALQANLDLIRQVLLSGRLVKHNIIRTQWIEEHLEAIRHGKWGYLFPLMRSLSCEMWLDLWGL